MSLNLPLAVRLVTAYGDKHVTRELHDLTFRSKAPGGFASATLTLSRRLNIQPEEIADFGRVLVYDRRDGTTVWEGRIEDTGRSVGSSGETWQLTATGPAAYAEDRTVSLVYADRTVSNWHIAASSSPTVNVNFDDANGITMGVGNGNTIGTNIGGFVAYHGLSDTGHLLARVEIPWATGFTGNFQVRLSTSISNGVGTDVETTTIASSSGTLDAARGGSNNIPSGHDNIRLRFERIVSALTVTNETIFCNFSTPRVRGLLKDVDGNDIVSGYNLNTVLAEDVVRDLLGRLLTRFDGPGASIEATSFDIDQLAYPDGASARKVLDDLMIVEPAYYWAAWESNPDGLHRFEWRSWPTDVRYEATTYDGFDSPSSVSELYNAVSVRYRNGAGTGYTVRRTQTVASLDAAGITREAHIDLSDEVGSDALATQVGDAFLAEHAVPLNHGTLSVSRPIMDFEQSRMVQPWEIRPGHLIRVRDVLPRIDSLNATGRDGVTVFKIAATDFNAGTVTATLELDSYPLTVARAVADLSKRRITRKR